MAQERLNKHKTWIRDVLMPNLIENQKLIFCKSPNEHIEVKAIEAQPMSLEVAFMLTACYFVKITIKFSTDHTQCKCDDSKEETDFYIVVKFGPDVDADTYEYMSMKYLFSNEIITYKEIIPKIKCLSNSPKYYYSHNKVQDAVIVLSDFSKSDWKMSKSRINLSLDHILAAVKQLGEFHGEMYAMKLHDADTFNAIKNKLVVARYREGGTVSKETYLFLELGIRRATASVRASKTAQSIVPETFLKRLEEIMCKAYEYRSKRVKPIEPIATICHGDYLRNNIAFRYDADGKAVEAMMFDFQTMCYSSPMNDLCTFMSLSTGHEVRDKHFSDIFAAYHESVINNLLANTKLSESDIPDYLKYDSMLEEYARYLPYGLAVASSFIQNLHDPFGSFEESAKTIENIIGIIFDRGGEAVDTELRSLVVDMFKLYEKLNLTLEKM